MIEKRREVFWGIRGIRLYFIISLLIIGYGLSVPFLIDFSLVHAVQGSGAQMSSNLILITIDTLRADHLGCYGYEEIKTPNIDLLASEGVLFSRHYTPVPITLPSHVSIMTGLYPPTHGVRNNGTCILADSAMTMAEILEEHDYKTAAFIGAYVLHSRFGLAQGFELYEDNFPPSPDAVLPLFNERTGGQVIDSALDWLEKYRQEKFFLWIHLFDPHAPYSPPAPFREPYKVRPYDGEIVYVDAQIGRLREKLKVLHLDNNTVTVLTADHGEGLDDHGEKTHAVFIYDSTLRIPLILHFPGVLPQNKKITEEVCSIDILPTVLDLLKIKSPSNLQGLSLNPLIFEKQKAIDRRLYCESHYPELNFGWSRLEGFRTKEWKFIEAPRSELYKIDQDGGELKNLIIAEQKIAEKFKKDLETWRKELSSAGGEKLAQNSVLDAETRRKLESLGYVWTAPAKNENQLPDPKDMIQTLIDIDVAMFYSAMGLYHKAVEHLEKVIEANPANMRAHYYLAAAYEQCGKYDESIAEYQKVIGMNPEYSEAYNSLGAVYEKKGMLDQAQIQFEMAEKLNSNYMEVYYNLGLVYTKKKEYDKAIQCLEKAVKLDPNHPDVHNNLGSAYIKVERTEDAIRQFEKVIQIDPNHGEAYNNLGIVYKLLGDYEQAEGFFRKAITLKPDNVGARSNLAGFYIMKKEYEQAVILANEVLHYDDQWTEAYVNLGIAYFYLKEYSKAITCLEKAVSLDNQQAEAHANLALCYLSLEDYTNAEKYYQKALTLDPGNIKAHINMGTVYFKQQKLIPAIGEWEKSLELDPNSIEALMNLGSAFFQQGEHNQAIKSWKRVLEMNPDHVNTHLNLGNCYYQMGLTNQAIAEWVKTVALDNASIAGHNNLAAAYYRQDQIDSAIREWEKVVSLAPEQVEALYNLGLIYLNREDYDKAIHYLSLTVSLKPDFAEGRNLLERARWLGGGSTTKN